MTRPAWRRLARAEARVAGDGATVAGVDEAGCGPLAGPVVAAAVILDPGGRWDGLNDSKQLSAETREALYARVLDEARAFAWAVLGPRAIDRLNIRRARLEAMRRAVARLRVTPTLVLVDGNVDVPGLPHPQQAVVDGDATMLSIAAASVLAKVSETASWIASTGCGPATDSRATRATPPGNISTPSTASAPARCTAIRSGRWSCWSCRSPDVRARAPRACSGPVG